MVGEVFESLQRFSSHGFVLDKFFISDDNEVMKNFMCKPFHLCQKLIVCLNLLKRKMLCGLKENKDSTNLENWLKFTHPFRCMHNDANTYMEKDKEWKKRMIALNDMP
jgi:hypothetical protein